MKRVISCLITITLLLALAPLSLAEGEWFKSDDGVLEARLISFEETSYPKYTIKVQYRIDGANESEIYEYTYNLSSDITQYVTKHPELKNRKIPVSFVGEKIELIKTAETSYVLTIPLMIDDAQTVVLNEAVAVDIIYPNDFVNFDAMRIATLLNDVKASFINPDSFELLEAVIAEPFFAFHVSGENRMGGKTTSVYAGKFFPETGDCFAISMGKGTDNFGNVPASLSSINDKMAIIEEIIDFYYDGLNKATPISTQTIINYMD